MKYVLCFSLVVLCTSFANTEFVNSIDPSLITYVFYSRSNLTGTVIDYYGGFDYTKIRRVFKPRLPTVVLIHGWQDSFEADSNTYIRSAILSKLDANVIKIDWSPFANLGYFAARDAVPAVGRLGAELLHEVSRNSQYPLDKITVVGFSLGAHIAGIIGKNLFGQLGVIVALDPAGPFISSSDTDFSVHSSDAHYVQSIHTNGGTLGMIDPVGHSDFYPNGGSRQPGCGIDLVGGCAHNRAWEYFAESVTNNRFLARRCSNWANFTAGRCDGEAFMGGLKQIDKQARGLFYLETNTGAPYGRG